MANSKAVRPQWLQPMWERKKQETVKRVHAAVDHLAAKGAPVTLVAIRDAVKKMFQVSISTNTIHRNDEAYAIYLKHAKGAPRSTGGYGPLLKIVQKLQGPALIALRGRIARLRRESKSALISRLFELEALEKQHLMRENNLREEVLRLSLQARVKGPAK